MSRKSRQILSDEIVIDIARSNESAKVLAAKHGIGTHAIYDIRGGRTYKRLTNGRSVLRIDPSERDLYDELHR